MAVVFARLSVIPDRLLLARASTEVEALCTQERVAAWPLLRDAWIRDRLVLELALLDAPELLELLGEDRNRRPRLHGRTHRLIQRAPEARERSFVEARAEEDVEMEVVLER